MPKYAKLLNYTIQENSVAQEILHCWLQFFYFFLCHAIYVILLFCIYREAWAEFSNLNSSEESWNAILAAEILEIVNLWKFCLWIMSIWWYLTEMDNRRIFSATRNWGILIFGFIEFCYIVKYAWVISGRWTVQVFTWKGFLDLWGIFRLRFFLDCWMEKICKKHSLVDKVFNYIKWNTFCLN